MSSVKVSTPVFDPPQGTYNTDQMITISTETINTLIYYTVDGETPTEDSLFYTAPFSVSGDGTDVIVKAIAMRAGQTDSDMAQANYIIDYNLLAQDLAPTIQRRGGFFVEPITVTITAQTLDATLKYTTDSTDPSCDSGTSHVSPKDVTMSVSTTLKAVSCKDGYMDSDITEEIYTKITPEVTVDTLGGSPTPIQDAIDAASVGNYVYIPAGTYTEGGAEVVIDKRITLIGAGSGDDDSSNTIVTEAASGLNVIAITASGLSEVQRVSVLNMRVTGSLGVSGNDGAGIEIRGADGHIEFDNVVVTQNQGDGIEFDPGGVKEDIVLRNSTLSKNGNHGFRVPDVLANMDGLTIDNCLFEENTGAGAMFYKLGHPIQLGSTSITISDSVFRDNAKDSHTNGDLIFSSFIGDLTISNVTIESDESESGIRISGYGSGNQGLAQAGIINISDLTISGTQKTIVTYPSSALLITRYLGLANVSLTNVVLNSTAPHGLFLGTITTGAGPKKLDVSFDGTFADYDIKLGQHGNSGGYLATSTDIDATDATFTGATSNEDIETRVWHQEDDPTLGFVTWTAP